MPFRTHLLVVANQTVGSPGLMTALGDRHRQGAIRVTLLAPVLWSEREEARARLDAACEVLRAEGIEAEGVLGDADPVVAVQEVWDPGRFDEIIVSTFRRRVALDAGRPPAPRRQADRLHGAPHREPAGARAVAAGGAARAPGAARVRGRPAADRHPRALRLAARHRNVGRERTIAPARVSAAATGPPPGTRSPTTAAAMSRSRASRSSGKSRASRTFASQLT